MKPLLVPFTLVLLISTATSVDAQMYWNTAAHLGSTEYIAIPPAADLDLQGDFTIECWIKPDVIHPSGQFLLGKKRLYTTPGYSLGLYNGKIRLSCATTVTGNRAIPSGQWTHIAVTYDESQKRVTYYVNGSVDTTLLLTSALTPSVNTDSLYIGRYPTTGTSGDGFLALHGTIDDLRIWNRSLFLSEINQGFHVSIGTSSGRFYRDLVATYPFDRAFGGIPTTLTCTDRSGNGHHGVVRGAEVVYLGDRPPVTVTDQVAIRLDGDGDYMAGPSTSAVNLDGAFTLECWVYPRTVQSLATLIQKREGSNATGYTLYLGDNRPAIRTAATTRLVATTPLPLDQWSHIAVTYETTHNTFAIYINGVLDTTHIIAAPPIAGSDSLYIGSGFNGDFNGYIDEVRICNYAKSASGIRSYLWRSIDQVNEPSSGNVNVTYNFDGLLLDNANDAGPRLAFFGSAHFTSPWFLLGTPQAPLLRADGLSFPGGFHIKPALKKIPAISTYGAMTPDSLNIAISAATITDIKLYVALNHEYAKQLTITLVSPDGDSVVVFSQHDLSGTSTNVITIFDDEADTLITSSKRLLGFGPSIRPANSLGAGFLGKNPNGCWKLRVTDATMEYAGRLYAWGLRFNGETAVGVEGPGENAPAEFALEQNYPNPFNPETRIGFRLSASGLTRVRLTVYDVLGRELRVLVNGLMESGTYTATWDATGMASGIYFYRLEAGGFRETRKMMLLR